MVLRSLLLSLLIVLPSVLLGQTTNPNWLNEEYRAFNYPIEEWYAGYAMDKIAEGEQLIASLQRVENSARNKLIEQIQISIESSSRLVSSSSSVSNGPNRSELITIDYRQDIQTTTNASAVGVEVKSHFDANSNIVYAFAVVNKAELAKYYINQEDAIFKFVESELNVINSLIESGQKILALKRCEECKQQLLKSKEYRTLISIIVGTETAYSQAFITLSESVEKLLFSLQQSTKVLVRCKWECSEYPQYGHISDVVRENIETLISSNNCTIVPEVTEADYILELILSTTQRSDGRDEFAIISYYANVVGKLVNTHSKKQVVNIAFVQDPRLYSAGKNDSQAVSKAFRSQSLYNALKNAIIPGLQK